MKDGCTYINIYVCIFNIRFLYTALTYTHSQKYMGSYNNQLRDNQTQTGAAGGTEHLAIIMGLCFVSFRHNPN